MKLELDRSDLKPEYQEKSEELVDSWGITFKMLSGQAQAALRIVGKATFYSDDRESLCPVEIPSKRKKILEIVAETLDMEIPSITDATTLGTNCGIIGFQISTALGVGCRVNDETTVGELISQVDSRKRI